MNKQYRIRKNLKYDPLFEYHPMWLKIVWWLSFLFFIIFIGVILNRLSELIELRILQSQFFGYAYVILAGIMGYFINYYLMFGLYIKFGNNDPNYREKMINKRIKADNKIFIKTVENALKEIDKSKKKT